PLEFGGYVFSRGTADVRYECHPFAGIAEQAHHPFRVAGQFITKPDAAVEIEEECFQSVQPAQDIAFLVCADTHSLMTTSSSIRAKMTVTWSQRSEPMAASSCSPIPPALTSSTMVDSLMLM